MMKFLQRLLNRQCSGSGQNVAVPQITEDDWKAETATYKGQCPECGRKRPCTGYGLVLPHKA